MMHKRKAVSMQTHVVIKQEGLCAIRQQRPRQAEVHRVPGQLTHGGAWGPGLRPDEQAQGVARGPGPRPDEAADHNNGKEAQ